MIFFIFLMSVFASQDCVDCSLPPRPSESSSPAPIVYTENRGCRPHEVGQGRINNVAARSQTSSVPADREYLLYRRSEKEYEVIFQLKFVAMTGDDAPLSPTAAADMESRVRNCLAIIPPARSPDGREIKFRFITAEQKNLLVGRAPPEISINVVKASRGNAENYGEDFRCGQVIHELLHQAGLCDEYREVDGARNIGACRPIGAGNSIMSDGMHRAFNDAVGEPFSCDLSSSPDHLSYLNDANSAHKDFLLLQSFRDVGNRSWRFFGLNSPRSDRPKNVCCKEKTPLDWKGVAPTENMRKVSIDINTSEHLQFKSREAYFVAHPTDSAKKEVNYSETEYECKIADVDESLRPACREYFELLRPELESSADPERKMFACPRSVPGIPLNFDVQPGSFKLSGNTIHLRNQGNGRSLLHSGHFERLIAGRCSSPAAEVYDRCSRFAYEHNYTTAQKAMSCDALLPAECKSVDWIGALAQ